MFTKDQATGKRSHPLQVTQKCHLISSLASSRTKQKKDTAVVLTDKDSNIKDQRSRLPHAAIQIRSIQKETRCQTPALTRGGRDKINRKQGYSSMTWLPSLAPAGRLDKWRKTAKCRGRSRSNDRFSGRPGEGEMPRSK